MEREACTSILVGNSFPLSLVRRPVRIKPRTQAEWRQTLVQATGVQSYWGHSNTLALASAWAGVDLTPARQRPALTVDSDGYPCLGGQAFTSCWAISPDYAVGFRPKEGEIVTAEKIIGWQALEIVWEDDSSKPSTSF